MFQNIICMYLLRVFSFYLVMVHDKNIIILYIMYSFYIDMFLINHKKFQKWRKIFSSIKTICGIFVIDSRFLIIYLTIIFSIKIFFRYTLNGGIKPIPVPYISADNRSTHNLSTSSIKKVHHHQVNGGIPSGNVHATTLSRPSSRAGSRTRSRSRSKSRARSHSRPRNSRQNLNTSYGSSSHSISNGVPPTSIFPRHHQSSLSGQSHFSHTDSTGRLLAVPVQRMSRYWWLYY